MPTGKSILYSLIFIIIFITIVVCLYVLFSRSVRILSDSQGLTRSEIACLQKTADSINTVLDNNPDLSLKHTEVYQIKNLETAILECRTALSEHILNQESVIDNELTKISNWSAIYVLVIGITIVLLSLFFSINTSHSIHEIIQREKREIDSKLKDVENDIATLWNLEPIDFKECFPDESNKVATDSLVDRLEVLVALLDRGRSKRKLLRILKKHYEYFNSEDIMHNLIHHRSVLHCYHTMLLEMKEYIETGLNNDLIRRIRLSNCLSELIKSLHKSNGISHTR